MAEDPACDGGIASSVQCLAARMTLSVSGEPVMATRRTYAVRHGHRINNARPRYARSVVLATRAATGTTVSLDDLSGPALVVTFICNHCPYVQHVAAASPPLAET